MKSPTFSASDIRYMRLALRLARRAYGRTSPNPMVGAVLVKQDKILGQGYHHQAGQPHAEVEALRDAAAKGRKTQGATLYVTLEPCCTHGRTPPCTEAILKAGIQRVVVAAVDPNPAHQGEGFRLLEQQGVQVQHGLLAAEAQRLNEAFNHWIVSRFPFVTAKAAMTLDGKIATAGGESKWITSETARAYTMKLRQGCDAILVGINTLLADNPSLTIRPSNKRLLPKTRPLRRIVLDSEARTPLEAQVIQDELAAHTTLVVSNKAPARRVAALSKLVSVWKAPLQRGQIDLRWVLKQLGSEQVTHLLVEGGGEVTASFFQAGLVQRIAFFYAPKLVGGRTARKAVAGTGAADWADIRKLHHLQWRRLGPDLLLTALVSPDPAHPPRKTD